MAKLWCFYEILCEKFQKFLDNFVVFNYIKIKLKFDLK